MKKKKTLVTRLTIMMLLIVFGTILANLLVNELLLEKYYTYHKTENLRLGYKEIVRIWDRNYKDTESFEEKLTDICNRDEYSVLIWNEETELWYSSSTSLEEFRYQLDGIRYGTKEYDKKDIIVQKDNYLIRKQVDTRSKMEYLVLSGIVDSNTYVFLRAPLESIQESVSITSRFFLYVEIGTLLVSLIVILILSHGIAKPIQNLSEISKKMTNLDFNAKYHSSARAPKEVEQLGNNMNELSETLENTISMLKSANIELQKDIAQKEQMDEMRKEFLSNVSHELKTPLALIAGYAEGLKEGISDNPDDMKIYCDVICDETEKMNQMVQKLLSLNQLEFGNQMLEMKRFDITELICGKLSSLDILLRQKEIAVSFDENECYVWGDEFLIEEVVGNFLSNAINYAKGEKILRVFYERINNKLRVNVYNTGDKIPEESLEYVWNKFYKVDKARSREYGGNGIGLSIVRAVMEQHKQNYGVFNTQKGVQFWFELELDEKP